MFWLIVTLSLFSTVDSIRIGTIQNYTIIGAMYNSLSNITRDQCICRMVISNALISALNYFQINQTCQLFSFNISSIVIQFNLNSSLTFINQSLLSIETIQANNISNSSPALINDFWSFDGDFSDKIINYIGIPINNVSFSSPGINGYGSALYFNGSRNQSVLINSTPNFNLSFTSFTFELWINPFSLPSGDRGMIGQCQSQTTNQCLHIALRSGKPRISFFGNFCENTTLVYINTWYHLAFVYNYVTSTQLVYANGVLDCSHSSSAPLQVTDSTVPLTIGYTAPSTINYFDGLIDQLSLVGWVKNSSEILNDATLVAWYSFDNNLFKDSGPNGINGIGMNTMFGNNSLLLNTTQSYFQSTGFVLLGISNRSYSFSIWINPIQTNGTAILYATQNSSNTTKWCLPFLGFNSRGQILAQSRSIGGLINVIGPYISTNVWAHIAQTYSLSNGVSLYINGSLFNKSSSCDYLSSSTPLIITLGSTADRSNATCLNTTITGQQYMGWIDGFRIYSRELTSSDVQTLAIK